MDLVVWRCDQGLCCPPDSPGMSDRTRPMPVISLRLCLDDTSLRISKLLFIVTKNVSEIILYYTFYKFLYVEIYIKLFCKFSKHEI